MTMIGTVSATCEAPASQRAVDLRAKAETDLSWLITHRFGFDDAPKGHDLYANLTDGQIKLVFEI